ncbi:Histidine kinase-like ATPase domain-containing protein [Streptomyces sp. DvalAA-14]|uniref:ATP-binding protein n=1 Tax=unclassified Streptomyces TaxID=2593676 RepID=UPI00081B586E|nr:MULTISPECIES: ATP-binding protein [unclassified Streptomyces]MYS23377.1 ATP-binding protein [Streptomyces sp. SID4948]SCE32383.1 Histidine kinase-like ATPase domain-containing protein [Streptomyces sp. DvalAA-14]
MGVPIAVVMSGEYDEIRPRQYTPPQRLWTASPDGVHRARHALASQLAAWGMSALADDAGLVLSELMTNAQRHGRVPGRDIGTSFLRTEQGVILEVHDARDERPVLTKAADTDERGRGLAIIDAITGGRWGVTDREGPGKVVWAAVLAPADVLPNEVDPSGSAPAS